MGGRGAAGGTRCGLLVRLSAFRADCAVMLIARAAAMPLAAALNAPPLHGFSPVRPLRVRTPPRAAPLLAAPRVAHPGYRPPPMCFSMRAMVVLAKPWSGVRRQRHGAAL